MTGTLQQAEIELRQHIERLHQRVTQTRMMKIHAEEEYERARDTLQSAECSLQFLEQFREQLGACEVEINITPSETANLDKTCSDVSSQEGAP